MHQLTLLKNRVEEWELLAQDVENLRGLEELASAESDGEMQAEIEVDAKRLREQVNRLELETLLGGEYAENNAILAVHAGAGGTEAQDWADMLLRMYIRWAENRRFKVAILDRSEGEEAGIKSATLEITGPYAYGRLRTERGVHRLVRLSPYDAAHRRHTSFALVEVLPEPEEATKVEINPDEVKIDVFRSSGAGGQNVQKTSTAIRITHVPTGIVVTCQNERSQAQNKETALKILAARLAEIEEEKREAERSRLNGDHVEGGVG